MATSDQVNFPQDFTEKEIISLNDICILWDSDSLDENWVVNVDKFFSFTWLVNFLKWKLTTSDVPEWTNKYVTDANLDVTNTIMGIDSDILDLQNDKEDVANKSTDWTFASPNNTTYPTTQAVKTFTDNMWVPINAQTAITSLDDGDEFIIYDTSAAGTRKIIGNDVRDSIYSKAVPFYWVESSDTIQASADTERTHSTVVETKYKEFKLSKVYTEWWTVRIRLEARWLNWTWISTNYSIWVNWVKILTNDSLTTSYVEYSENVTVAAWDLIQVYLRWDDSPFDTAFIRNVKLCYDDTTITRDPTVNLN